MKTPELDDLLARFFDGTLDEAGTARLEELLAGDDFVHFKEMLEIEGLLRARAAEGDLSGRVLASIQERDLTQRVMSTLQTRARRSPRVRPAPAKSLWGLWAAAAVMAAFAALLFHSTRGPAKEAPTAHRTPPPAPPAPEPVEPAPPVAVPKAPDRTAAEIEEEMRRALEEQRKTQPPPAPAPALPAPPPVPHAPRETPAPAPKTVVAAATLIKVVGEVRADVNVPRGQGVETIGPKSAATLKFADGTLVEIGADTRLKEVLDRSDGRGHRLVLEKGSLEAQVSRQPAAEPMVFVTPQAEAQVVGTTLRIEADAAATRLEVTEGKVRLTRTSDRKSVDVAGGHFAVAAPGAEFKAKPLPKWITLLSFDFETGAAPAEVFGAVEPGPKRPGNRNCLAGRDAVDPVITRVKLGDATKGDLFIHRDGAVVSFDYWVSGTAEALDLYFWNATQRQSMGAPSILPLTREKWTRASIPLSEFGVEIGRRPQEGDRVSDLTIQLGGVIKTGALYIDNVEVGVPRKK